MLDRPRSERPRRVNARILVVDDDAAVRSVMRAILESGGHRVAAVGSAADALPVLETEDQRFELLLTDVVMAGTNGPQLAAHACRLHPGLRVLYTSGHAEELLDARGVLASRKHFIAKPFVASELLQRVEEILSEPAS
jgi:CheY-like chemotaxis protein